MKKVKHILSLLCALSTLFASAQNKRADSLSFLAEKNKSTNNKAELAKNLYELGGEILSTEKTAQALDALENSAGIFRSLGDSANYAKCLYKISYLYNLTGEYSKSFTHCLHASTIAAEHSLTDLEGQCQNQLGRLYYLLNDEGTAMQMYEKALENGKKTKNDKLIAEALCYMAIVWRNRDSLLMSMNMQREALKLRQGITDEGGCASSRLNIGILYSYLKQNDSAVYWLSQAEKTWGKQNDYFNLAECYNYLGKSYIKLNDTVAAENYFNRSLQLSLKVRAKKMIRYNYYELALINNSRDKSREAFEQIMMYTYYKDSVIHDQGLLEIARLEVQSIQEKKDHEIQMLNKNNEVKILQLWYVACGLLLVIIFSAFIFRSLRITRQQKLIIEKKQEEILSSIQYAQRIQKSLLTSEKYIAKNLNRLMKKE